MARLDNSDTAMQNLERHIGDCLAQISNVVEPLAPKDREEQLTNDLFGILKQAVALSQTLRCQRAAWSVRHIVPPGQSLTPGPVFFKDRIMEDMDGGSYDSEDGESQPRPKIVDVVVSPALFKRGNTDGERFDVETCIEKAQVKAHEVVVVSPSGQGS